MEDCFYMGSGYRIGWQPIKCFMSYTGFLLSVFHLTIKAVSKIKQKGSQEHPSAV